MNYLFQGKAFYFWYHGFYFFEVFMLHLRLNDVARLFRFLAFPARTLAVRITVVLRSNSSGFLERRGGLGLTSRKRRGCTHNQSKSTHARIDRHPIKQKDVPDLNVAKELLFVSNSCLRSFCWLSLPLAFRVWEEGISETLSFGTPRRSLPWQVWVGLSCFFLFYRCQFFVGPKSKWPFYSTWENSVYEFSF